MSRFPEAAVQQLCLHLQIDAGFFVQCVQESVVEVQDIGGRLDLGNGTALRLRQLERICSTLNVDLPIAVLLSDLVHRVAELEREVLSLRGPSHP